MKNFLIFIILTLSIIGMSFQQNAAKEESKITQDSSNNSEDDDLTKKYVGNILRYAMSLGVSPSSKTVTKNQFILILKKMIDEFIDTLLRRMLNEDDIALINKFLNNFFNKLDQLIKVNVIEVSKIFKLGDLKTLYPTLIELIGEKELENAIFDLIETIGHALDKDKTNPYNWLGSYLISAAEKRTSLSSLLSLLSLLKNSYNSGSSPYAAIGNLLGMFTGSNTNNTNSTSNPYAAIGNLIGMFSGSNSNNTNNTNAGSNPYQALGSLLGMFTNPTKSEKNETNNKNETQKNKTIDYTKIAADIINTLATNINNTTKTNTEKKTEDL